MRVQNAEDKAQYRDVWVVAEILGSEIQRVTHELLGVGRRLADKRGSKLGCVVLGHGVTDDAKKLFHYQADTVIVVDDPKLEGFVDETQSQLLVRLIEKHKPEIVLCGATSRGRALIPRVAVLTESGLTADCTGLDIDEESGVLLQTRPAFGGNIMATIKCEEHRPQMSTVRPRVFEAPEPDTSRTGELIVESMSDDEVSTLKKIVQTVKDSAQGIKLSDAQFIITGGRGLQGPDGFKMLNELAELANGAVGASRAAVDAGWISYPHQVGQTGQTVQAKVYMACGVSGQIQHLVGMQSSDLIVAINTDPDAPIMKLADIAIVGDLYEVVPAIIKELRAT